MDRSKWEYKKLGDICKSINAGGTPSRGNSAYWNGDIPWVKIRDMNSKYVNSTEEFITEEGLNNSSAKLFEPGTILYSIFATIGAASILEIPATTNQAIAGIVLGDGCDRDFYYYYLTSLKTHFENISKGVAQNNINLSVLRNQKVVVPPISDQQRIVAELDCLNEMIAVKQEQLKEFDKLAQSIFYDMFGDPVSNEKGWNVEKMGTVCSFSQGIQVDLGEQSVNPKDGFQRFIRISDYTTNDCELRYVKDVDQKYHIDIDDIAIVRYGASAGFVCVGLKGILANNLFKLNHDKTKLSTVFLKQQLSTDYYKSFIKAEAFGVAMPALSFKSLKHFKLILPPLSLQQQFAEKISAIEAQKELVKKSIAETQQLLDSRMDYYFD